MHRGHEQRIALAAEDQRKAQSALPASLRHAIRPHFTHSPLTTVDRRHRKASTDTSESSQRSSPAIEQLCDNGPVAIRNALTTCESTRRIGRKSELCKERFKFYPFLFGTTRLTADPVFAIPSPICCSLGGWTSPRSCPSICPF